MLFLTTFVGFLAFSNFSVMRVQSSNNDKLPMNFEREKQEKRKGERKKRKVVGQGEKAPPGRCKPQNWK